VTTRATSDRQVLGRYLLGPAIGRGATAVVHRARDLASGEAVAVKVVPVELGLAPRVRAEVRAASRLDHPCIVAMRDWGEDRECLYLVWELVEGPSLAEVLRDRAGVADRTIVRAGEDVLAALAHAHDRGVVHRDVKPANILLGPDGRARLSDFGVARLSGESGLTLTGGVVGTVAYMAPEQARGEGAVPASDVYSACLVVYEGLAGANPIAAGSPAATARRAAAGALPPLARARPDLARRLCAAVDSGLGPDPAARPSARELADELAAARGAVAVVARRRGLRALPAVACGVGGAAIAAAGLRAADGQLAQHLSANWQRPGVAVAAIAVAGLAFAWRPRAAAALAVAAGTVLVGLASPAAAAVLGAVALAVVAAGWRTGRLILLPAAAPALFALGLGPLYAAIAGLAPRWPARLWAAAAGMVAALAWQVGAGADALLATGDGPVPSAVGALEEGSSPATAVDALWRPLADRPEALAQAAALVVAALCVPLVLRARAGGPRMAACALWLGALGAALVATATAGEDAVAALVPTAVVVLAWAVRPWRVLRRRVPARASATLRNPTA
jgi:eukaryotic-like serine/threonine-protein kinase